MAFIGYSLHNIAQASQKIGLGVAKKNKGQGISIWITATLSTSIAVFIILYAVSIGNVSIVGAMSGSGLASLTLYTRFVMKEKITKQGLIGVLIVMGATGLIGAAANKVKPPIISIRLLFFFLIGLSVVFIMVWFLLRLRQLNKSLGIFLGIFAGILGGFIPLFQKVSTSKLGKAHSLAAGLIKNSKLMADNDDLFPQLLRKILEILANPYALIWIVLSIISMIILQFAYTKDKAIRVIPAFSAITVILPVIGGVFCFHESLSVLQWVSIFSILSEVVLITIKPSAKKSV